MRINIPLSYDNANTDAGEVEIIPASYSGKDIHLAIEGPDRKIAINVDALLRALRAIYPEKF